MRNNHPEELGTPELEGGRSLQSAVPASWGWRENGEVGTGRGKAY